MTPAEKYPEFTAALREAASSYEEIYDYWYLINSEVPEPHPPEDAVEAIIALVASDLNLPETRRPAATVAPAPEPTDEPEEASNGTPKLLPFAACPGYQLDEWGVPCAVKSKGRRAGRMTPNRFIRKGSKRYVSRYKLTVNGKQKPYSSAFCDRARYFAEQKWRNAG